MTKQDWRKTCRFTAHASHKRYLTKKELSEVMEAQLAMARLGAYDKPKHDESKRIDPIHAIMHKALKMGGRV
jgi:hypothetical protein